MRLNEKKTVESGELWSEEAVPRGTTFITLFLYSDYDLQGSVTTCKARRAQTLRAELRNCVLMKVKAI